MAATPFIFRGITHGKFYFNTTTAVGGVKNQRTSSNAILHPNLACHCTTSAFEGEARIRMAAAPIVYTGREGGFITRWLSPSWCDRVIPSKHRPWLGDFLLVNMCHQTERGAGLGIASLVGFMES